MTDYIEREAAIAAINRNEWPGDMEKAIRAIPSAPSQREAAIRERIGEVRLFLDTGFLQLGVTIDYDPADIFKTLQKLDALLALLDQPAPDPVGMAALNAFRAVLSEVERTEITHTRNAGTDYRCREFFVEHGQALLRALAGGSHD